MEEITDLKRQIKETQKKIDLLDKEGELTERQIEKEETRLMELQEQIQNYKVI